MIIDTSNAPCGPGFLPGLRLSEGRFAIDREATPAAGAVAGPGSGRRSLSGGTRRPPRAFVPLSADPLARVYSPASPQRRVSLLRGSDAAAGGPLRYSWLPALRRAEGPGLGIRGLFSGVSELVSLPPSRRAGGQPRTGVGGGRVGRPGGGRFALRSRSFRLRPQIRRDYPLNLSILLSGGKETNQDSLSSGERRGKSPAPNPRPTGGRGKCGVRKTACPVSIGGLSPSDRGSARGRCEAGNGPRRAGVRSSRSRVVWECSPKRVVNSI